MKKIASLIMSVALASSAIAGPVMSSKGGKIVNPPAPENCFGAGLDIGIFGAGFLPTHDHSTPDYKDSLGGGILADYFFCENFGIQLSYAAVAADGTTHLFNGDVVLRAPIQSLCIAPYLLVGGGFHVDGSNLGEYHVGGGIEAKFKGTNLGAFVDGTYNWHSSSNRDRDYTLVRLGVKFHL